MTSKVAIYTWSNCIYSQKAKALLQQKQVKYIEYCIDSDEKARKLMSMRTKGKSTLPQIFVNNSHIGGYKDLYFLGELGTLDEMLDFGKVTSLRVDDTFFL